MEPNIRKSDQLVVIGKNGSGKSWLAFWYFLEVKSQKIFINVKNDPEMQQRCIDVYGEDNVSVVTNGDAQALDFKKRVLIYTCVNSVDVKEIDRLYARLLRRRDLFIWLDEAFGPTTSSRVPDHLALVMQHGRFRNLRHMSMTQRPVRIAPMLITEAHHIIFFPNGFNSRDKKMIADNMGMDLAHFDSHVVRPIVSQPEIWGDYGHAHYEGRKNKLHLRPSVHVAV